MSETTMTVLVITHVVYKTKYEWDHHESSKAITHNVFLFDVFMSFMSISIFQTTKPIKSKYEWDHHDSSEVITHVLYKTKYEWDHHNS